MTMVDETGGFRVSRRLYYDDSIYKRELDRVFRPCWLFLGHESEVAEPGDYVTRRLGVDPVILTRDENGNLQVLLNSCRHRGTMLCRSDMGNSSHFRCSYHGWTYANTGDLVGVTFQRDVYGKGLDKTQLGLYRAAKVDTAYGLIFATWNPDAPPLEDYLGDIGYYLESIFAKFDEGLRVVGPPLRSVMGYSWKAETENLSGDGYHTPITHQTAFEFGLFARPEDLAELAPVTSARFPGRTVDGGNGHTVRVQHLPITPAQPMFLGYPEDLWPQIGSRLQPGQVNIQSRLSVMHGTIFPSMSFLENFKTGTDGPKSMCRYIRITLKVPLAANRTEVWWWHLVPTAASARWRAQSIRAYARTNGPGGMFEVDDGENFVSAAEASSGPVAMDGTLDLVGGMEHEPAQGLGWPGRVMDGDRTEHTIRALLRRWNELMDLPETGPIRDTLKAGGAPT